MNLIDGKALAAKIREEVKNDVKASGQHALLKVLLVGDDPASRLYVDLKKKAGLEVGIDVSVEHASATTSQSTLEDLLDEWNANPSVTAILIQVPLPQAFTIDELIKHISPEKDADGFHPGNPNIISPLHEGVLRLIAETPIKLPGSQGVIIANSDIFAKPLERLLTIAGVSIDIMSPDDINKTLLADADMVISAIGRPHFLHASLLKDGAVLIDIGTSRQDGKTLGDFDRESIQKTESWLTPVPGGVGPMTVALLLKNVLRLATLR